MMEVSNMKAAVAYQQYKNSKVLTASPAELTHGAGQLGKTFGILSIGK